MEAQKKIGISQVDVVMWLSSVQRGVSGCAQFLEDTLKGEEFVSSFDFFLPISWNVVVMSGAGAAIWGHEGEAVVCYYR